ncbi:ABC transporter substrate-binding protein [Oceanobacter mangrovi]|uniref:ABC transporter substrate-binding protein n=1 Tax=Oceanobacter mangrovi TaxID=2862510 RepID=UPI001C8D4BC2|nr:ABC transporter substrate-binding protein [Oceanobacter mangrovi]
MSRLSARRSIASVWLALGLLATFDVTASDNPIEILETPLPAFIDWQTNVTEIARGVPEAVVGGTFRMAIIGTELNLRRYGPDSSHALTPLLDSLQVPLLYRLPGSDELQGGLADHWAISADHKRLSFRLRNHIFWSDGVAINTEDIVYTFRSVVGRSDWAAAVVRQLGMTLEIHDERHFSIVATAAISNDLIEQIQALRPLPKHYWSKVQWFEDRDWRAEPTSGPYNITRIIKNQQITLSRRSDWWGLRVPLFWYRYNVSRVMVYLLPEAHKAYQMLERGELDTLQLDPAIADHETALTARAAVDQYHYQYQPVNLWECLVRPLKLTGAPLELSYTINPDGDWLQQQLQQMAGESAIISHQTSAQQLNKGLATGQIRLAWFALTSYGNPALYLDDAFQRQPAASLTADCHHQHARRSAGILAWRWVEIPAEATASYGSNLLDPFDIATGGYFWIDARRKSSILTSPGSEGVGRLIALP